MGKKISWILLKSIYTCYMKNSFHIWWCLSHRPKVDIDTHTHTHLWKRKNFDSIFFLTNLISMFILLIIIIGVGSFMFHFSWNETKIKSDEISSTKNKQQTTICLSLTLIRPVIIDIIMYYYYYLVQVNQVKNECKRKTFKPDENTYGTFVCISMTI